MLENLVVLCNEFPQLGLVDFSSGQVLEDAHILPFRHDEIHGIDNPRFAALRRYQDYLIKKNITMRGGDDL